MLSHLFKGLVTFLVGGLQTACPLLLGCLRLRLRIVEELLYVVYRGALVLLSGVHHRNFRQMVSLCVTHLQIQIQGNSFNTVKLSNNLSGYTSAQKDLFWCVFRVQHTDTKILNHQEKKK